MGVWGAAQAIAFGAGGFLGTLAVDLAGQFLGPGGAAYAVVFAVEALLFLISAKLVIRTVRQEPEAAAATENNLSSKEVVPA